ncbi:MAG: hypothetical protein ACRCZF_12675 [Gemmataceae bacterium]
MTRMGKELTLVLLGAGVLGGAYLLAEDPAIENDARVEAEAQQQLVRSDTTGNGNGHSTYHRTHFPLIWMHSTSYMGGATSRAPSMTPVTRGGFGGIGRGAAGG